MARPLQAKIKALHYTFAPKTATVTQNTKTRHEGCDLGKRWALLSYEHRSVPLA